MAGLLPSKSEVHQAVQLLQRYCKGASHGVWRQLPACCWRHRRRLLTAHRTRRACVHAVRSQVESAGHSDELKKLVLSVPPVGALEWPPAMAFVLALAGKWSRQLGIDVPVWLLHGDGGCLVIQESKLSAAGEPGVVPVAACSARSPALLSVQACRSAPLQRTLPGWPLLGVSLLRLSAAAPCDRLSVQVLPKPRTSCASPSG